MTADPGLASWLVVSRREIERRLAARLGGTLPAPASPEAEALRRFRSFAVAALGRGEASPPALDGLRVRPGPTVRVVEAWVGAATELAGPDAPALARRLEPLARSFRSALRATTDVRRASGAPVRSSRRAVAAAIDRVADAFLAVDTDTGRIVDANPAAGALLGLPRDRLLEREALAFVAEGEHTAWTIHVDAMAEGGETRRFGMELRDAEGGPVSVEVRLTRLATRRRTLALVLARPLEG